MHAVNDYGIGIIENVIPHVRLAFRTTAPIHCDMNRIQLPV